MSTAKFDDYARSYDALHNQNLAASGEPLEYFSAYKRACLERHGAPRSEPLLDYGAGIGNVTLALVESFSDVHGFDLSSESLKIAAERMPSVKWHGRIDDVPDDHFATIVVSGVLHHVPRPERMGVLASVRQKLKPGGRLFVFEHNPLNPVTRHTVATCPFDDDADLLFPWQAKALLRRARFADVKLEYIVFFPRPFARLRSLEPHLGWLPAGAQLLVMGRR